MKAIILAAGIGSRLGLGVPKALTIIDNGNTIMDYQIAALKEIVGIDNILVVVGYKKELIMEQYPQLTYVYNKYFATTGTAKSLLCGLKKIDEDVIFINGDVYFEKKAIETVAKSKKTGFLVDKEEVGEEEIKYTLNEKGFIYELSKKVINGLGEATGINIIIKEDLITIKEQLDKVDSLEYFEKAFENLSLENKIDILPIDRKQIYVKEIDFLEDLENVRGYKNKIDRVYR